MKLRIIGGKYGGRSINPSKNNRTHPMSERVRNALFNSIQAYLPKAKVLDVFAGTGSVGIEALSRGVEFCTFVEKDRVAQKIIAENIELLDIENAKIVRTSLYNWLQTSEDEKFDLIFADPPYHDVQLTTILRLSERLVDDGLLILSHPSGVEFNLEEVNLKIKSQKVYGNANLTVFCRA